MNAATVLALLLTSDLHFRDCYAPGNGGVGSGKCSYDFPKEVTRLACIGGACGPANNNNVDDGAVLQVFCGGQNLVNYTCSSGNWDGGTPVPCTAPATTTTTTTTSTTTTTTLAPTTEATSAAAPTTTTAIPQTTGIPETTASPAATAVPITTAPPTVPEATTPQSSSPAPPSASPDSVSTATTQSSAPGVATQSTGRSTASSAGIQTTSTLQQVAISPARRSQAIPQATYPFPDPPLGEPIPQIASDQLISACKNIQPKARNPAGGHIPTKVYFTFFVDGRRFAVDDVAETIDFVGDLRLEWQVVSCEKLSSSSATSARVAVAKINEVWHPPLKMNSNPDDMLMLGSNYGDSVLISYFASSAMADMTFFWTRIGKFKSICKFDLQKFPFDTQTCVFEFQVTEPNIFVTFAEVFFADISLPQNGDWHVVKTGATTETRQSHSIGSSNISVALFSLTMRRDPSYVLFNILSPCILLIILLLGSFAIPPTQPDRILFAMTILLALIFAQAEVLRGVPRSSNGILFTNYFLMLAMLTAVCLWYFVMILNVCNTWPGKMKKSIGMGGSKMKAITSIDTLAFLFAFFGFIGINVYAALVVMASG